jgi:hypothetical protein
MTDLTFNIGDIIEFSTTATVEDFNSGEKYRITNIATTDLTIVQHPRGAGGLKRACCR